MLRPGEQPGMKGYEGYAVLNDTQCRNAKPRATPHKLTDGKGVYLEVTPKGGEVMALSFRNESVHAIGDYCPAPATETESRRRHGATAGALCWPKRGKSAPSRGHW